MKRSEKLKELQAKRQELINSADALLAIGKDESLTPEQTAEMTAKLAEVDQVTAQIDALAKEQAEVDAQAARLADIRNRPDNPQLRAMLAATGGSAVPRLPGIHATPADVTSYGMPRNARRTPVKNFRDDGTSEIPAQVRAYRFGMWALASIHQQMGGRYQFQSAVKFCMDHGIMNTAHGEGAGDTTGSHLFVPDEFSMDLILLREQYGVARQILGRETMSSDTKTVPRQLTGLTAYFREENAAGTESNMTFDNITLVAKNLMAIARLSNELNADSAMSFGDKLAGEIAYAFAEKEDDCAFNGDGTSTYGGIVGIRTQLDTLTAGTAPGYALGAGNAYSELLLTDFEAVVGGLPQYADRPGTGWLCHKTFYSATMMRLALAAGGVTSVEIINGIRRPMFLGYPVYISQKFPSTAANSQVACAFGDFSLGGKFGDRQQDSIAFSDQATVGGQSMWERNQIGVRGTERFDVVIHDFGSNSVAGPIGGLEMASS